MVEIFWIRLGSIIQDDRLVIVLGVLTSYPRIELLGVVAQKQDTPFHIANEKLETRYKD
jgi:hypothetical protein